MSELTPSQIAGYAQQAGFRGPDLATAVAVALAESGGDPAQVHPNSDSHHSTDKGLWQINDFWNKDALRLGEWSNPADNARMAYHAWRRAGWGDWVTYTSGAYREHMADALQAAEHPVTGPAVREQPTTKPAAVRGGLGGTLESMAGALSSMVPDVDAAGQLAGLMAKLFLPSTIMRAVVGSMGIALVLFGIILLGREIKNG